MGQHDAVVVMEDGTRFPGWLDRQAGSESNVAVLAEQPSEGHAAFCAAVQARIDGLGAVRAPRRAVLVATGDLSSERQHGRRQILRRLAALIERAGGGQVVLVADGTYAQTRAMAWFAVELNEEIEREDGAASIQFRAAARPVGDESAVGPIVSPEVRKVA